MSKVLISNWLTGGINSVWWFCAGRFGNDRDAGNKTRQFLKFWGHLSLVVRQHIANWDWALETGHGGSALFFRWKKPVYTLSTTLFPALLKVARMDPFLETLQSLHSSYCDNYWESLVRPEFAKSHQGHLKANARWQRLWVLSITVLYKNIFVLIKTRRVCVCVLYIFSFSCTGSYTDLFQA